MSRCIHVTLLRLQEVWLAKFVTTGLAMPAVNFMRDNLPTESDAVVGNFGIYIAYALVSSGHLPLMNLILFLAFMGEGLVARVAWIQKRLDAKHVEDVAAPVVKMARVLFLDGRNRAIVLAEPLARVIAAIRIASVCWRSYLPPKHRNESSQTLRSLCCDSNRAIGVHSFNIRSMRNGLRESETARRQ